MIFPMSSADLKAFEQRLTETVSQMNPAAGRWRLVLVINSVCTVIGAYQWLTDSITFETSLIESLYNHYFFTLSLLLLIIWFFCGIHKRVVAPSIVASRCRQALSDFNMSCDDTTFTRLSIMMNDIVNNRVRGPFNQFFA